MSSAVPLTRSELIVPFEGFRWAVQSLASVTGAGQPLVELAALQSVVCAGVPGLLGYPDPEPMPRRFRRTVVVFHRHRSPTSCDAGSILSCASFSCRVPSDSHLLARSRVRAPPLGSRPSSRHQHQESTVRQDFRSRRCSARSVSHALDGLLLLVPCAFVSPRCRVQGFASGVASSVRAAPPRRWPLPSRRWRRSPAGCPAPANVASTSGSCSRSESAVSARRLSPRVTRVPSCFSDSLGRFTETWAVPSHVLRSRP